MSESGPSGKGVTELDPSGKGAHEAGAKLDHGKINTSLLKRFGMALMAVSDLATLGAIRYSRDGWAEVEGGVSRYEDAMIGHYLREAFETHDPDMNMRHEVSVAWNALARLQLLIEQDKEWCDRLLKRRGTEIDREKLQKGGG